MDWGQAAHKKVRYIGHDGEGFEWTVIQVLQSKKEIYISSSVWPAGMVLNNTTLT